MAVKGCRQAADDDEINVFESQYLYDMSRLYYLRSILRNCWSRDFASS
jgi:hypothetical protein